MKLLSYPLPVYIYYARLSIRKKRVYFFPASECQLANCPSSTIDLASDLQSVLQVKIMFNELEFLSNWDSQYPRRISRPSTHHHKMNYRLVTLGIILFFLTACRPSSSFKHTNYRPEDKIEPQEVSDEFDEDFSWEHEDSGAIGLEEHEKPLWSPEEDPNYENGLAKLLKDSQDRGDALRGHVKADNDTPVRTVEKPSYMFSLPDLKKLVRNEIQIYGSMKSYLLEVENRLNRIKRFVFD